MPPFCKEGGIDDDVSAIELRFKDIIDANSVRKAFSSRLRTRIGLPSLKEGLLPFLFAQVVVDPFTKQLTSSSKGVQLYCRVFPPSGEKLLPEKPGADFANLIALGFSALITPDDYVKSKI